MDFPLCYKDKYHLPVPTGKYVVGCADVMVGPNLEEGCFVRIFYPCTETNIYENASRWASWIPLPEYADGYATVFGYFPFLGRRIISRMFANLWAPVVVGAQPMNDAQFPVIVFSHGLTACRTAYSTVCSELCSHGFLVAAVEHRDGSACMSYSLLNSTASKETIKEWVLYKPMRFEWNDFPLRQEQLSCRVRDCQRTLDLLFKLNNGNPLEHILQTDIELSRLKGIMDLSSPVLAGHSFGSATTLRTLAVDKRFRIGVALDAWMWPLKEEANLPDRIEQPILFVNMEGFQKPSNLKVMKPFTTDDAARVERRVVTLKGSVHMNQVDVPFLLPWYARILAGAYSTIDPQVAMQLNNYITLLYINKHLGLPSNEEHQQYVDEHQDLLYEGIS